MALWKYPVHALAYGFANLGAFGEAIDAAVADRMAADESVVVFGEDVPLIRRDLAARFGASRVRGTPISESAFLGAAVGAAMAMRSESTRKLSN